MSMASLRVEGCCAARRRYGAGTSAAAVRRAIEPSVAAVFDVEVDDLRAPTRRSPQAAFARQVAKYHAHVACAQSHTEVGTMFERDRTTVAHACGVVEDSRDDPDLDRKLEHLERAVGALIDALSMRHHRAK
jgi:chromosomal replication initiation ATPase DnaA